MINTRRANRGRWMMAAIEVGSLAGGRPVAVCVSTVALVAASSSIAASAAWVLVASSPDVQIFVDAGSLARDSSGFITVWTKTNNVSPQRAAGIEYMGDMTRFVVDCAGARYGVAGGKFLDAHDNVLRQFDESARDLRPIPAPTKIDAVAKAVCTTGGDVRQSR